MDEPQNTMLGKKKKKNTMLGNSLVVQWLGLRASAAGGTGSIPGLGTKFPHALAWPKIYTCYARGYKPDTKGH